MNHTHSLSECENPAQLKQLQNIHARMTDIGELPALNLELTSFCQVKCVWCLMQTFDKIKKQHMDFDKFNRFVDMNASYLVAKGTRITPFHRGEPLLYPHFWESCAMLNRCGIPVGNIATNLSMKINVDDFVRNPIEYIVVNLGGTTKEVHEQCMMHSSFDLVSANLRKLWAAGVPVRVKINPTRMNAHQIGDLPDLVERLGGKPEFVTTYTTFLPHPNETTEEEKRFFMETVYDPEHRHLFRFSVAEDGSVTQHRRDCPGALMVDTVFADGGLSICCHDHHKQSVVADAFSRSLEEIRSSDAYRVMYWQGLNRRLANCRFCV